MIVILGILAVVALSLNLLNCVNACTKNRIPKHQLARAVFNLITMGAILTCFNQEAMELAQNLKTWQQGIAEGTPLIELAKTDWSQALSLVSENR